MESTLSIQSETARWTWSRGFAALATDGVLIAWGVVILELARAVMIGALRQHLSAAATAWSFVSVFLNGFRFDLRVATIAALPCIAASVAAFRFDAADLRRRLRVRTAIIFTGLTAALVAIDVGYFEEFGDQFDHFLFGLVWDDRAAILKTVWAGYPVIRVVLGIALVILLAAMMAPRLLGVEKLAFERLDTAPRLGNVVLSILVVVVLICCVRGSIGRRPAQMKTAAVTGDDFLNKMVVNPFDYLAAAATDSFVLRSAGGGLARFLHGGDVRAAAKRHFHNEADLADLDAYARHVAPGTRHPARHVIVIVMESYSAWATLPPYRALHLGDALVTLSREGLAVGPFVPAGPGTMASLGAIVTGLPDAGLPLSYEPASRMRLPTSSPVIFKRLGYRTRFFYGGYLSWQRIGELARDQGFDEVHGGGEIGNWLRGKEWGVDDEYLFDFAQKTISDSVPSFDLILSVSNHPPFGVDLAARGQQLDRIPPELALRFDGSVDLNVLGHFRYADRCMGLFVRAAAARLTDPVFAVTGDHYGRKFPNAHPTVFERLAVPLVLYGPQVLAGRRIGERAAGSHIDIIPTLVDLAAPAGFFYLAFGRDLLMSPPDAAGLGCSAAVTADGIVEFSASGASAAEGTLSAAEIELLRRRYDDLHALGWWRVRKGVALPGEGRSRAN